jgi:hypothetical protein
MARCSEDVRRAGWSGKSPCHQPAEFVVRQFDDPDTVALHACRHHLPTLTRRLLTGRRPWLTVHVRLVDPPDDGVRRAW